MAYMDLHKGLWRVRMVIRPDLRPFFDNKTVLVRSTGTGNRAEANKKAAPTIAEFKGWLARAEAELRGNEVHDYLEYPGPYHNGFGGPRPARRRGLEPAPDDAFWQRHTRADGSRPNGVAHPAVTPGFCAFSTIYSKWEKEQQPSSKTVYSWKKIIRKLVAHVRGVLSVTEDELMAWNATELTNEQVIGWKDALVSDGLAPTTISNHLTILRTIYNYAARNKLVPAAAAESVKAVKYKAKKKPGTKRLGYTEDDARRILLAARAEADPVLRWSPWLAAFTGARIDEICGAMVADIVTINGDMCMHIRLDNRENDPEQDAEIKTENAERKVPLHAALVTEGFLDYVVALPKDGPLFPRLKPDRFGRRGGNGSKRVGRWIRKRVKITDPRKAPSHSWRHRFRTLLRNPDLQIGEDVADYLSGHGGNGSEGRGYGEYAAAAVSAISKLPLPLSQDGRLGHQ